MHVLRSCVFSPTGVNIVAQGKAKRQAENYRRMGPLSRPLTRSGHWSQTTTGIQQPAARLRTERKSIANRSRIKTKLLNCYLSHSPGRAAEPAIQLVPRQSGRALEPVGGDRREVSFSTLYDKQHVFVLLSLGDRFL